MRFSYSQSMVYRPFAILKKYGENDYKLITIKSLRQKGFEELKKVKKDFSSYSVKLANSISRSRARIFELAICNEFEYFVTLTINPEKYDRCNLSLYYKDFSQFIRNYRKKYAIDIQYLFIPELHKDGKSWHMHGFIMGIPESHFSINANGYLDWYAYSNKFGYISLDKIRDKKRCSLYITKYVSKNFKDCIQDLGSKMYYCSKGLNRAVELNRFELKDKINILPSFSNEFCNIYWLNDKNYIEYFESK